MMHVKVPSYLAGTQYSSNMFPSVHSELSMLKLASQLESADWLIVDAPVSMPRALTGSEAHPALP